MVQQADLAAIIDSALAGRQFSAFLKAVSDIVEPGHGQVFVPTQNLATTFVDLLSQGADLQACGAVEIGKGKGVKTGLLVIDWPIFQPPAPRQGPQTMQSR